MRLILCSAAVLAIILAICTSKEYFILLSGILTIFALLEIFQTKKEKEELIWYKEIKEERAEGKDWDDIDKAFFDDIKNN